MNYAFARSQYKKSRQAGLSGSSDPHEMITLTLEELSRCLRNLQSPTIEHDKKKKYFSNAFTAVYILQTSLDFEKGGEIAKNLFKLYEYCRNQLQKAMNSDHDAKLEACENILNDIKMNEDEWLLQRMTKKTPPSFSSRIKQNSKE